MICVEPRARPVSEDGLARIELFQMFQFVCRSLLLLSQLLIALLFLAFLFGQTCLFHLQIFLLEF